MENGPRLPNGEIVLIDISEDHKLHIEETRQLAASVKVRIEAIKAENMCMDTQLAVNKGLIEYGEGIQAEALVAHNDWRKSNGYPTVKSL